MQVILSRDCTEISHVSASFYMTHVKFYMHENLTAAGNSYKIFPCNIQNLNAADISQFLHNFHGERKNSHAHFQKLMQSKFGHRDDLFIPRIFYCAPLKIS